MYLKKKKKKVLLLIIYVVVVARARTGHRESLWNSRWKCTASFFAADTGEHRLCQSHDICRPKGRELKANFSLPPLVRKPCLLH